MLFISRIMIYIKTSVNTNNCAILQCVFSLYYLAATCFGTVAMLR